LSFILRRSPPTSTLFPYTTLFRSAVPRECAYLDHRAVRIDRHGAILIRSKDLRPNGLVSRQHLRRRMPEVVRASGAHHRDARPRSEEHTSELQSRFDLVCRLLLEK